MKTAACRAMDEQEKDQQTERRPKKSLLKKQDTRSSTRKSAKFDEMNILSTLHPTDKDYGHMKILEPKTPYNRETDTDTESDCKEAVLDVDSLAEKLQQAVDILPKALIEPDEEESSDDELTEEEKQRRKLFKKRRKEHYNEYLAMQAAKKLLEEEEEDDDDDDGDAAASSSKQS
nr:unnamed protein product [Callosobruchus analis]